MVRSAETLTAQDTQHKKHYDSDHDVFSSLQPVVVLALWRVRKSWLLLLITGLAMVAAVMLVCAVPLFSQVALTAGVRNVLQATPESSSLTLETPATQITSASVQTTEQQLTSAVQHHLGAYLRSVPDFSLQAPNLDIVSPNLQHNGSYNSMLLYGASIAHATTHLTLLIGHLPQDANTNLDIAITPTTASTLKVSVGSTLTLRLKLTTSTQQAGNTSFALLTAHVVGLFEPTVRNDLFWHGMNFAFAQNGSFLSFQALTSNLALIHALTILQAPALQLTNAATLAWSYRLDPLRISSTNLNTLIGSIEALQVQLAKQRMLDGSQPSLSGLAVGTNDTPSILASYQERVSIVQIPMLLLSSQVLLLVLFFLVMTTELLVGRQAESIALLRSRGASRGQVVGAMVIQSLGLVVVVLLMGPLLALFIVHVVMSQVLSPQEQSALNTLSLQALWNIRGYALTATLVIVLTMLFTLSRAVSRNVMIQRRESARSTRQALSQRLRLDLVAAIVALTGYAISQYIINGQTLDTHTTALLAVPLALIAPLFLGIAILFFSLRFFPFLLYGLSRLASRARGVAPVLAFAQMARTPLQFIPRTLLLAFTTAFAVFALVFTASQTQHTYDVAAYQTGADFSGFLASQALPSRSISQVNAAYSHIVGVNAVTVGEQEEALTINTSQAQTVELAAVDARNLAQTVNWQQWNSGVALPMLMQRLTPPQQHNQPLPALTDATLWETLHLGQGSVFALQTARGTVSFVARGELPSIPQAKAGTTTGIVITSYTNYANYTQSHVTLNATAPPINCVWVRSSQNLALRQHVRTALSSGSLQLAPLYDRSEIAHTLQTDPLYLGLLGILTIGTITALLLSLLGNVLAFWVNVQTRQIAFAALRALGTTSQQIVRVLIWEQGSVYVLAILPGLLLGLLLAVTVVPMLVFTSASGSQINIAQVDVSQTTVPTQLVFPPLLLLVMLALILICVVGLCMMIYVVPRLSLSQTLRINED